MTWNTSAVAGSRSRKYSSRNVINSKVRLCYMFFMLAAFKIDLPVFHFFSLVSSFTPYERRRRVMTVKVTILLFHLS